MTGVGLFYTLFLTYLLFQTHADNVALMRQLADVKWKDKNYALECDSWLSVKVRAIVRTGGALSPGVRGRWRSRTGGGPGL